MGAEGVVGEADLRGSKRGSVVGEVGWRRERAGGGRSLGVWLDVRERGLGRGKGVGREEVGLVW